MRSSWLIAAALTIALGAWLATPYVLPAKEVDGDSVDIVWDESESDPVMRVRTVLSKAHPVRRELQLNGHSEASRRVTLRAETDGRIVDLPKEKGDYLLAGALVAALDERDGRAWEIRARAMVREREIEYEAARKLSQKGFQSEVRVAQAFAQLEEARATLLQSQLRLDHAKVKASFAGLLENRMVEVGDFVQMGDPIAEVVELDPLKITADVPEAYFHRFGPDTQAQIKLAGFEELQGRIEFLASEADLETRTFHVEIEVDNPNLKLPAGVTAEVSFAFEEEQAHALPTSSLGLDDAGRIGIKYIDELSQVAFAPAEIIRTDTDRIWLSGLPAEIEVITVGQGFVRAGQKVEGVRVESEEPASVPVASR